MILSLLLTLAQVTPVQPMPHGTGLPPAGDAEPDVANAMVPVNALLAAIAARDGAALLAQVRPDGSATAVTDRVVRRQGWAEFAAGIRPGPERYAERLTDPAVEVDGDIAMVWSPYVFTINGAVHHCGFDHFDLVREAGRWRVLNITWSQRATGCDAR